MKTIQYIGGELKTERVHGLTEKETAELLAKISPNQFEEHTKCYQAYFHLFY
ncbi:cation-transporting P-type ATPase [Fredinandcohnia sp. 179-A 10B2 NHS]|uniref:cation-transporting P-type ATPase n=1 Tax=Fredinandcohnia sp. 179-A 10B2 NHS TaxID=3235176 RepID=UPI0039A153C8